MSGKFGVIYVPKKNLLYYAAKDLGAFKQQGKDGLKFSPPKRIISSKPLGDKPPVVIESKSHPSPENEAFIKNLVAIKNRISAGSSLKFCLVAEGKADIYPRFNPTMEWDVAAGDCIFRNSRKSKGQRISYLKYNKKSLKNKKFVIGLE